MKLFVSVFSFILIVGLFLALSSCSQMVVDPIVPVVDKPDTNIVANKVTFTVDVPSKYYTVLQGEQLALHALVVMHKDARSKDSAVRNYVLSDSSISWSIVSGPGTINSDGLYTAPEHVIGSSSEVHIVARAGVDATASNAITIVVRAPNLMPLTLGNYWIRSHYPLDSVSGDRIVTQMYVDSSVVSQVSMIAGRESAVLSNFRQGVLHDTLILSSDPSGVYAYRQPGDNLGISNLPAQWMKIVDIAHSTWTAYDTTLSNFYTSINNQPAVLSGRITIQCERASSDSVHCDAGSFKTQAIVMTTTVNLQLTINGISIPVQYVQSSTQWMSDNVGTIRSIDELLQGLNPLTPGMRRSSEESILNRFVIRSVR